MSEPSQTYHRRPQGFLSHRHTRDKCPTRKQDRSSSSDHPLQIRTRRGRRACRHWAHRLLSAMTVSRNLRCNSKATDSWIRYSCWILRCHQLEPGKSEISHCCCRCNCSPHLCCP